MTGMPEAVLGGDGQLRVLRLIRRGPDLSVTIIHVCVLTYDLAQNLRKLLFKSEKRHKGGKSATYTVGS